MKLLTKTTLYFLIAMVPLLVVAGIYLFMQFSKELDHRMDEELVAEEVQWIRYLQNESDNGTTFILRTPELLIYPVNAPVATYPTIQDIYDTKANNKIPFRQLSHIVPVNGVPYQIIIRKSQEQKSALEVNITRIMFFVFIGLFATTILFNWFISTRLWKPFRNSLEKIRNAELQKMEAIRFEKTAIEEFNELNASLNSMTTKIHNDYVNMKEFTENAAHEMQTPLAVVQSKMELLLQDSNLTDNQVQSIMDASMALSRLSKLNQSLLLLAKIENNQYETNETNNLTDITKKYLKLFDELIKDKQIITKTNFEKDFILNLHPFLADSLISNLLGNAVKYNYSGGKIIISVHNNRYQISNTSNLPPIDSQQLFKRFNKSKNSADTSNGLGLAIVKRICDTHNLSITYSVENGLHQFNIQKK
ncbi:sensor histidine kinase [Segetibacter koreensis]|uniref:sensor histidine kinase n=1 Tax=Segetibacter koreensis TaxID=398037 RepID=UPI0003664BCF|nr:HAMP domain-containing sensor histidine kinase [Segetibacter koreensis]